MPAPFVQDVSPTPPIERGQPVQFALLASAAIVRAVVAVDFPGLLITEVAWVGAVDGGGVVSGEFSARYAGASAATAFSDGGFDGVLLVLARAQGWPDAPGLRVYAVDAGGLEV